MAEEPRYNLSRGNNKLTDALESRFPDLNRSEIEEIGNVIIGRMGDNLLDGGNPAILKRGPDNKLEVRVWDLRRGGDS